jgi:hypothetical protein
MYNFIILSILLILNPIQDPSGFWIPSTRSSTTEYSFKSKYISKVGSKITIWLRLDKKYPEQNDDKSVYYTLMLEECDCSNISTKTLSIIEYGELGDIIHSYSYNDNNLSYAPPGSVSYRYITDICSRFSKKKK